MAFLQFKYNKKRYYCQAPFKKYLINKKSYHYFDLPKSDNSLAHFGEAQNIREQGDFPLTPFLDK